jgi:exonuclease III
MCWNVNGLATKLTDPDFVHFVTSYDICCLTETFSLPNFDFSVCFGDFIVLHSPAEKLTRHGRPSGGTVLMYRKELDSLISEVKTEFANILCVKISKTLFNSNKDVFCIGMYNHPTNSIYYNGKDFLCSLELLEQFMLSLFETDGDVHFLIGGDLNARVGEWSCEPYDNEYEHELNSFTRKSQDETINSFGKTLIEMCTMFELTPLNGMCHGDRDGLFTFHSDRGNSVIDYILCSVDLFDAVDDFHVLSRVETEHMSVCARLLCSCDTGYKRDKKTGSFEKISWDSRKLESFLSYISCEEAILGLENATKAVDIDVEASLTKFNEIICNATDCMKRTVHFGPRSRETNKWFDNDCRKMKRETKQLLNRYVRKRTESSKQLYKEKRANYHKLLKEKKRLYNENIQDSLLNHRNDSKKFWSTVNSSSKKKLEKPNIDINLWKEYFENILTKQTLVDKDNNDTDNIAEDNVAVEDLDMDITEQEVKGAIRRLKSGKAAGLDNVIAESLKASEPFITPFLTKLFNKLFQTGYFPENWSRSIIAPIFKKGDALKPENYRGISLLSVTSKLFTAILNKRLYTWAEQEHKINDEQAGFRKDYSTIDHIFSLLSMIRACFNGKAKGKFYVAFIDYKRAFDSIDRNSLWKVLQKIKMSTKMMKMLQGMYSSVQSCVRWGQEVSDFFDCPAGVKQGCLLSPLIFSLLISEIGEIVSRNGRDGFQFLPGLKEFFLLLFADDIALVSTTPIGLQNQLRNLENASKLFGLTVNLEKTKVMVFRKGGHLSKYEKWFYNGEEIEVVNNYRYLGFTFTTRLSEDTALRDFVGKAKGKILHIMKCLWRLGTMHMEVFFKLFDAQVKPSLLYAAEVWGMRRFKCIESAHLFGCKRYLSVSPKTPNVMIYGETGRFPLYVFSTLCAIKYWFKLQKMNVDRIPKQAYEMQKNRLTKGDQNEANNWAFQVKTCLNNFGFSEVWLVGGVVNEKLFLSELRQRMTDCYKQEWSAKMRDSDRFIFYRSFKSLLKPEEYLANVTISKFRNALIRLRLGVNELGINKRFGTANRNCPFCNAIETEQHFVFECQKYSIIRDKFIAKYKSQRCVNPDLILLLQSEDYNINRDFAMYIYYALRQREKDVQGS